MLLSAADAALASYACGLARWRASYAFCSRCGTPTSVDEAGHLLVCEEGHRHHPRVEPVVQMLVEDGRRCLLGRSGAWPTGWFSTLAGFVEAGETLEEAVVRETREETGVEVEAVTYLSSQFWAGPYSLMVGFRARARDLSVARAGPELESVRVLAREELREELGTRQLFVPPASVAAGRLIEQWLGER